MQFSLSNTDKIHFKPQRLVLKEEFNPLLAKNQNQKLKIEVLTLLKNLEGTPKKLSNTSVKLNRPLIKLKEKYFREK